MKNILKTVGIGAAKVAVIPLVVAGSAISAIWETTGTRGNFREALDDCSDSELIDINIKQSGDDGDFDIYMLSKSLLKERNYVYNNENNAWEKQ
ncbi:hypothetical protein [Staphylococcus carnosus]|uniref:hypothetical protein n=1 Tax=Staphylococcus carnosus TaxID=1281 RepID=UPI00085CBD7D|nr:hypothetical protein [Staphylococcus carnosus]UTB79442.1 hypothetical protein A2I65_00255 [Staphylococcus carnosus]SCS89312.1 Uncharacterised protein [Staphylococcus cohnii subsp. cohnii]